MTVETASSRRIEYLPLDDLEAATRNPKRHDLATVRASIDRFGFASPALRDERTGRLVVGHGRTEVLRLMRDDGEQPPAGVRVDDNGEWVVPVICGWASRSDAEAEAYLIADNHHPTLGGWDESELADVLASVNDADDDLLAIVGYAPDELAALIDNNSVPTDGLTDPDDVPNLEPDVAKSAVGDMWQLGPHRLIVGDATDASVWSTLLDGRLVDGLWTDPPYGVSYVGKTADALTIENDALSAHGLRDFLHTAFTAAVGHCRPGACWYVAAPAGPLHITFANVLVDLGIFRQTLVWVKDQFVMGRSDYHYRHEPIFYGWVPGGAHNALADRTQDSVHEIPRPRRSTEHPTMKPVELIERHVANSTKPGDLVVDSFAGSGSTLMAAHRLGRVAALIELDPTYADVICCRWQEHTGDKPINAATGEPTDFIDVVAEGEGVESSKTKSSA